jgi:predicted HTH transcriptional regulator
LDYLARDLLFILVHQHQSELNDIEVKSAHGGTPQRLFESLSAFANRPGGGVILFGLDEKQERIAKIIGELRTLLENNNNGRMNAII